MQNTDELQFTQEDISKVSDIIDNAAQGASTPSDVLQRLTEIRVGDPTAENHPLLPAVERAFAYAFVDDSRKKGAVLLGVWFSSGAKEWPPAFKDVSTVEKEIWRDVALRCKQKLARVHLLDVALSSRCIEGADAALRIANLYLDISKDGSIDDRYRGGCLRRCWSLARKYDLPLESDARREAYSLVQSLSQRPVVALELLLQPFEILTVAPRKDSFSKPNREEVQDLLKSIRSEMREDMSLEEDIAELLVRVANSDTDRDEARRWLIESYIKTGSSQKGILASHWFEKAAQKARKFGYTDLRDMAVSNLQKVSCEELNFIRSELNLVLPKYTIHERLFVFRNSRDALTALDIWFSGPSPTGVYANNKILADKITKESILSSARITKFDKNMPVRTDCGDDGAFGYWINYIELHTAALRGDFLVHELEAIKHHYSLPKSQEIAAHLVQQYRCDPELAVAFEEALVSFWEKRYGDAARSAFPLVEAGVRGLLLVLEDPLYRVQNGNLDGHFPSLEKYIKKLQEHDFDIDWIRCILNPVATLRNALAHGHKHRIEDYEAAILLRVAALFVLLTPKNSSEIDKNEIDMKLRDPIRWVAKQNKLVIKWKQTWVPFWETSHRTLLDKKI